MIRKNWLAALALLVLALPATAVQAQVSPGFTVYRFVPYLSSRAMDESEHLPSLTYSGQSGTLFCTTSADNLIYFCKAEVNIVVSNYIAQPTGPVNQTMMVGGLPPTSTAIGGRVNEFLFSGNFEGLQFATGGNVSADCSAQDNLPSGTRCYIVVSYPDFLPVNCEWNYDANATYVDASRHNPNGPCWPQDRYTQGKNKGLLPMRFRFSGDFYGLVSDFNAWVAANKTVIKTNPAR